MNIKNIKNRIDFLKKELIRHDNLYYDKNDSEISDNEYDNLVKELEYLEKKNPFFVSSDLSNKKVSGVVSSSFEQVKHSSPMLSLDNTYSQEQIEKWHKRIENKFCNRDIEFIVEPKVDGVSLSLTYLNGILIVGATRGNGEIGENVTENIKTIKNLPHKLEVKNPPKFFELRGEVYITKLNFEELNKNKAGKQKFVNSRNAAAGSLRQKNSKITAKRELNFFAHSFGKIDGKQFQKQSYFLQYCQECGFQLQNEFKICNSLEEIMDFLNAMLNKRDLMKYEIDGLVIKINNLQLQDELGCTNKSPRWAVAFKFPAKQATTKLNKIRVRVGRTGIITPSAILEPIVIAGVTISHATLHNFEEIKRLNVNERDTVLIERAGDVIPKIVKVVKKGSNDFFRSPYNCPSCNSEIVKKKEVAYRCINPECPAQFRKHLIHFVSRNAMDINGFGEVVINQLLERKKIQTLADIYHLTFDDLIMLNLFKKKKANNLIKSIAISKNRTLSRLIFAFGICYIGKKTSEIIAKRFKNIDVLLNATIDEFIKIPEIGNVMALSLKKFFENKTVRCIIHALIVVGVNMVEPEVKYGTQFYGKVFVLTGELEDYTREQAYRIIKSFGGEISSFVSEKIDYVLAGKNAGLKLEKAKVLNVKIIDEIEFKRLTIKK